MDAAAENRSVREAEGMQPRLRGDLRFSVQEQGGRRTCVIEDPASSQFHRVGLEEYCFLRALDGRRSVAALVAQQARAGGDGFDDQEAMQILHWARSNHLLAADSALPESRKDQMARTWRSVATWLNPLSIRVPLGRPDRVFAAWARWLRGLFGWPLLLLWLGTVGAGAALLIPEARQFAHENAGLLARDNWLWMLLGWTLLKIAHEIGHGVVCRHFGAPVREVGVIFILGVPMGYVDATASIALASKWQRIAIAAAGVAVEFFLAGIAAVVWTQTAPGALHSFAHNVVITGTVLTLLFNANPLMRFDGYFILTDLLDLRNLATRGRQWTQGALSWLLLGGRPRRPARPENREEWIVAIYGVAAWFWQISVSAALIMGASVLLRGGGLLIAVLAAVLWMAPGVGRFVSMLQRAVASGGHGWGAPALRLLLLTLLAGVALFLPWHRRVSGPAVVELPETLTVRAECAGFVERVLVEDGQTVEAGALLVQLRNEGAAAELAQTRTQLLQQEQRARLAYTRQDVATFQAESAKSEALRKNVTQQERYFATLEVRAPFAGKVTGRPLANLAGRFLRSGEEVLRLGQASGAELKIAVSERLEPAFRASVGQPLEVRVAGVGGTTVARLTRMEARASREIAWPPLTAFAGGPVALRRSEEAPTDAAQKSEYELADPYFTATARLENAASLLPGQTALVRFRAADTVNLGQEMQEKIRRWIESYAQRE